MTRVTPGGILAIPVPANTIPAQVGVRCLPQVSMVTHGYSQVSRQISILIYNYTKYCPPLAFRVREGGGREYFNDIITLNKIQYIIRMPPLSHLERERGLSSLRTEQKSPPAHVCSERR